MGRHRSFVPSDFTLRDVPWFFVGFGVLAVTCVLAGMALESLPLFWRGLICGLGLGFTGALWLLGDRKEVDVTRLPEPSEQVRLKCADPRCTFQSRLFAEVVADYCGETGATLSEAVAVLKPLLGNRGTPS